jgi:hypothetical protein
MGSEEEKGREDGREEKRERERKRKGRRHDSTGSVGVGGRRVDRWAGTPFRAFSPQSGPNVRPSVRPSVQSSVLVWAGAETGRWGARGEKLGDVMGAAG